MTTSVKVNTGGDRKPIGWKPIALDGGYGWVVVLGSFLIHVFADGFVYSFGVIAESLIKEFNATNAEVSTVLSLLTGLMLAAGPVASAVCNRIGCRITTVIGAIIASIGCAISFRANSMTFLIFSVGIIMGTGFGFMYCPAIVIVTMYFEKYRALATGVTVCGAGVGTFVFSRIIGILIVNFDWRTVFLIYSALVLLCVPCGLLYRPIKFQPIYEDDGVTNEVDETDENKPLNAEKRNGAANKIDPYIIPEEEDPFSDTKEPGSPKSNNNFDLNSKTRTNGIRSSVSQLLPQTDTLKPNSGVLHRFRSLGEHLHLRSTGNLPSNEAQANEAISISTGYLNIKDVFYHGSVTALPEYAGNEQRFRSISSLHSQKDGSITGKSAYRTRSETVASHKTRHVSDSGIHSTTAPSAIVLSADTSIVAQKIEEENDTDISDENSKTLNSVIKINGEAENKIGCERASTASNESRALEIWRTIKRLMDLSLLVDPIYLLFAISNFLTSIGFNAPPMFMPMNAETVLGLSKVEASSTVSAYGLANTFGRISFGLLCDRQLPFSWGRDRARNRLWIYNLTLMMCGFASCFVFAMRSYYSFAGYCFFFGFTISSYVCLTSVVLVDLVGVDRLTNAFGLLLFIQGIATFVGPPLAGQLFDLTRSYDWTFAFCGVCLFLSGIMLFVIPPIQKRKRYSLANTHEEEEETLKLSLTRNDNNAQI